MEFESTPGLNLRFCKSPVCLMELDDVPPIPYYVEEIPERGLRAPHHLRDQLLTQLKAVGAVRQDDDSLPPFPGGHGEVLVTPIVSPLPERVSIVGVLLGVAILVIVLSVMTGFDKMWRDKILSFKPHLTVLSAYGTDAGGRCVFTT